MIAAYCCSGVGSDRVAATTTVVSGQLVGRIPRAVNVVQEKSIDGAQVTVRSNTAGHRVRSPCAIRMHNEYRRDLCTGVEIDAIIHFPLNKPHVRACTPALEMHEPIALTL